MERRPLVPSPLVPPLSPLPSLPGLTRLFEPSHAPEPSQIERGPKVDSLPSSLTSFRPPVPAVPGPKSLPGDPSVEEPPNLTFPTTSSPETCVCVCVCAAGGTTEGFEGPGGTWTCSLFFFFFFLSHLRHAAAAFAGQRRTCLHAAWAWIGRWVGTGRDRRWNRPRRPASWCVALMTARVTKRRW